MKILIQTMNVSSETTTPKMKMETRERDGGTTGMRVGVAMVRKVMTILTALTMTSKHCPSSSVVE